MPYCTRCGRPLKEGEQCTCTRSQSSAVPPIDTTSLAMFFYSLGQRMGIGDPTVDPVNKYERGQKIVPENVTPNDTEVPVKQYNLCVLRSRLKFMRAEGRLQVTNKRVIFRAKGTSLMGGTTLQHEFAVDEIAGFQILRNFRFSILDLLLGIVLSLVVVRIGTSFGMGLANGMGGFGAFLSFLLMIATCVVPFLFPKFFLSKSLLLALGMGILSGGSALAALRNGGVRGLMFFLLAVGLILLIIHLFVFSFKPNMEFHVRTKSGEAVIPVRHDRQGLNALQNFVTGYNEVLPTDQTETAIREIGALINDIQKMGDFGIAKWRTE